MGGLDLSVLLVGGRRGAGGVGDCGGEVHAESLRGAGAFNLGVEKVVVSVMVGFGWRRGVGVGYGEERGGEGERTSHARLNVSRSTNSRATFSSFRLPLYCFKSRLHSSVYSASGIESLM